MTQGVNTKTKSSEKMAIKPFSQIFKWMSQLFVKEEIHIHSVYNCREILSISSISRNQYSPTGVEYKFYICFQDLAIYFSTDRNYQRLYDLRELFINNMGFSYLHLEESMVEDISINYVWD